MDYFGQNLKIFKNRLYHRNQRKILLGGFVFRSKNTIHKVRYILSEYFSLSSRYWTQIRPDGLIFDPYQGELKSFRQFEYLTKSRNKA